MKPKKKIKFIVVLFLVLFVCKARLQAQMSQDSVLFYKKKIKELDSLPFEKATVYFQLLDQLLSGEEKIKLDLTKASYYADNSLISFAEKTYHEALRLAKKEKNFLLEAQVNHALGYFYYGRSYHPALSYKHSLAAQKIYKKLDNKELLNIVKTNLATLLVDIKEYEEADANYKEALAYYEKNNDSLNIVFVSINIGRFYQNKKNYTESDRILKSLLKDFVLEKEDESLIYYNLALNQLDQENYVEASKYIGKSIALSVEVNDVFQLTDLYFLRADIEFKKEELKKALMSFQKALEFAKEINDYPFQKQILQKLIHVSAKSKDYSLLDVVLKDLEIVKDSMANQEKSETIKEVYLKNRLNLKNDLIQLHQIDIEKQKELNNLYVSIVVLTLLFLTALIAYIVSYRRNSHKRMLLLRKENQIKEIEDETKRRFEIRETKRIQENLQVKKKELMLDLALKEQRVEKVEQVLNKIDSLSEKSIISKNDVLELKQYALNKYEEVVSTEKLRKDMLSVNKEFYTMLLKDFPSLSRTELKVLSFFKVNLETKEIANIQNVSVDAIRKTRYRIRKKIGLKPEESLEKFIMNY